MDVLSPSGSAETAVKRLAKRRGVVSVDCGFLDDSGRRSPSGARLAG